MIIRTQIEGPYPGRTQVVPGSKTPLTCDVPRYPGVCAKTRTHTSWKDTPHTKIKKRVCSFTCDQYGPRMHIDPGTWVHDLDNCTLTCANAVPGSNPGTRVPAGYQAGYAPKGCARARRRGFKNPAATS